MKRLLIAAAILFAISAQARFITEKDLFRFQWIADPQISPDGSQVAFVRITVDEKKDTYNTAIWSVATAAGAQPRRITNGPYDGMPRWSSDGKALAFLRATEKDGKAQPTQIWLLPMNGSEPRALTTLSRAIDSIAWSPAGNTIAFTAATKPDDLQDEKKKDDEHESDVRVINQAVYRSNGGGYRDPVRSTHLWVIDAADDAKPKQITSGDFSEEDVMWSPDGSRIYFTSTRVFESYYDRRANALYSIAPTGGEMAQIASYQGQIGPYAPSPDGKSIAFAGEANVPIHSYNQPDLFVVAGAGGPPRNLTTNYDYDVLSSAGGDQAPPRASRGPRPVWSADGKTVYITAAEEGRVNLKRVDTATGAVKPWTTGNHALTTFATGGGKTVAIVSTPTAIGDLFLVGDNGALTRLTNINDKLWSELTLTEPDEIWYTSFDGKKIEAWMQKPPDFDPSKKYPLILDIHGGPHAAYGYVFDHEFQWMAAKGYVVLYPNPRGSTSYGQEFGNVIQYRYPGDDYKDLMAGA